MTGGTSASSRAAALDIWRICSVPIRLVGPAIERFGVAEDGRLFRSENGNPIQPSTYRQVWGKVRALALTPAQRASPLMRRPYDLRHSGITWRLNSGVPPTEIAAWAGHSVELLLRVYARCVAGLEDVWISRMEATLRPPVPKQENDRQRGNQPAGASVDEEHREKPE